jgi:hypothetical protein
MGKPTAVYCDSGYRASIATSNFAAARIRPRLQHSRKLASKGECGIPGRKRDREGEEIDVHTNRHSSGHLISRRAACLIGSLTLQFLCAAADAGASVDTLDYPGTAWSPYLVGAAIGVLSWLTFYFSDQLIGASSFYAQLAGFLGQLIAPRHTALLTYFKDKPPRVNWGFVFVVATIVGGAIAALTGGEFANEWLPPVWEARFGDSVALRAAVAFTGGVLMAFGARLAGGCTSGHGISGTLQLNLASWITVICIFVGGIAVAQTLFNL